MFLFFCWFYIEYIGIILDLSSTLSIDISWHNNLIITNGWNHIDISYLFNHINELGGKEVNKQQHKKCVH